MKCVVWAGELTSRSRPLGVDSLPSGVCSLCARSVREPSSDGSMTALVASVIAGLGREEAGQATYVSSKRYRSQHSFKTASGAALRTRRYLPSAYQ